MDEILCEICGLKPKTQVKWCKYVCDDCVHLAEPCMPYFMESRNPFGEKITTAWDKETKKRVILGERPEGGNYIGTIENGKIRERTVDIR